LKLTTDHEAARRLVGAFRSEAEAWPAYLAALEAAQDPAHDFLGLDTGFAHLNYVANGLMAGLFVLGASPSTGKTTFVKQLADQVVEANPDAACLFVSLEQSREELRVKTLSRLSGVENRDILRGRLDRALTGWKAVKEAAQGYHGAVAGRFFILEGDKTTTPDRIRLAALQVKRATQAARLLVVVDYLQIVPTEEQYRDPRNRVDAVVSDLRRLARDLDAAVVAVSSVGRTSYASPGMAAFKESGGVEYGADLGAVMTRKADDPKGQSTFKGITGRQWKRVSLDIVKNRNGERSRIEFDFFPQVSTFVEKGKTSLPDEDPEA
jgi:replicative DNA helicase